MNDILRTHSRADLVRSAGAAGGVVFGWLFEIDIGPADKLIRGDCSAEKSAAEIIEQQCRLGPVTRSRRRSSAFRA